MIRNFLFLLVLLIPAFTMAQEMLVPSWKSGDSLRYFLSESSLIDEERISLITYELQLNIVEAKGKSAVLEGHLYLNAEKEQGEHWSQFYKRLSQVPFVFYFEAGRQNTFTVPIRSETTKKALDQILLELLDVHGVQPLAYGEISDWLASEGGQPIPEVLRIKFDLLNKIFDKYGAEIPPSNRFAITDHVDCADTLIYVHLALSMETYPSHDTLIQESTMSLDSTNSLETYSLLNRCGKLKGLEDEIKISSYSYYTRERWAAILEDQRVAGYAYDEEIRIGMDGIQNWQRVQKRIISLW